MLSAKRSRRIIISVLCLCIIALFTLWAAAGLHSMCCVKENCSICTTVHSSHYFGIGTDGILLSPNKIMPAVALIFFSYQIFSLNINVTVSTPVNLKIRLDI